MINQPIIDNTTTPPIELTSDYLLKVFNDMKPRKLNGVILLPSVNGFDVYKVDSNLLKVFLHSIKK